MARKKVGDDYGSYILRLLCWTLAACWLCVTNGEVYIVTFKEQALAQELMAIAGGDELDMSAQHDLLLNTWLGITSNHRKVHDYKAVFNGVAVDLTESQVAVLRNNNAVWSIQQDDTMYISTTHTPDYMNLPAGAWTKSGGVTSAGEDIVIGVVDSGIYPDHPSFANDTAKPYPVHPTFKGVCNTDPRVPNGFCNGKIIGARQFFNAAILSGAVSPNDPDVTSPLDSNGHGTHCAGTAAGNNGVPVVVHGLNYGNASGAAPRARLAIYKALNAEGQGRTSDIIAAIDQAVADGVHVLSLSLGPSTAPVGNVTFTDSFALACLGAVKAGVYCVHAAGNAGPGTSTVTSWSPWLTSVGATTTDRYYTGYFYTGDGKNYTGQGLAPPTPGTTNYPLISATDALVVGGVANPEFDCADASILDNVLITGKILVCTFVPAGSGAASLANLSRIAAESSGAVGVVLLIGATLSDTVSPTTWNFGAFPGIAVSGVTSFQSFQTYYLAGKQNAAGSTGRFGGGTQAAYSGEPPKIAAFSSRGPNYYYGLPEPSPTDQPVADVLKPNVVAPGVDIWSAWTPISTTTTKPLFQGEKWSMISGTSMAAPHVSGVAAIVKQVHPDWSPSAIASAFSTTALPVDTANNTLVAYDYEVNAFGEAIRQFKRPGNAFDFGNGFVDATAALDPGLIFDATYADYIKFLCAERLISDAAVKAATSETCPLDAGLSSDLNLPSITIGNLTRSRIVPRTVTNVGLAETYNAVIIKPAGVEVVINPPTFTIAAAAIQPLTVTLTALSTSVYVNQTSFGRIYLIGNLGHKVQVPVTVTYKQV